MSNIHDLIAQRGIEEARALVKTSGASKHDLRCLEIAAEILAEESEKLGITHSGFCLTALPHRDIAESVWRREGHKVVLLIRSGLDRDEQEIGIPYGSKARMILIYLQSEALRANSPKVEMGKSMNAWLERMGVPVGGNTYVQIREQARRLSSCELTFFYDLAQDSDEGTGRRNGHFVKDEILIRRRSEVGQGVLWREEVTLDAVFFEELRRHPVPLWEPALRSISGKSMALDIYLWLAYRLHALKTEVPLSWPSVYQQFGAGFGKMAHFKPEFVKNLQLAMAVYPDAKVKIGDKGLILIPSPPAVRKLELVRS